MNEFIEEWILNSLGEGLLSSILIGLFHIILAAAIAAAVYIVLHVVLSLMMSRSKFEPVKKAAASISSKKLYFKVAVFVFFASFYLVTPTISTIGSVLVLMMITCDILDVINDVYQTNKISRQRPIKGVLSVVKVTICILLGIILISILLNQNPVVLISGVGAFTAVLSLIFKDALSGLVAGIQITSENMFEIGDWISIPSLGVEGEVKDIALISVKIQGFDNIMHTLPASTFVSTSSKNWHKTIRNKMRQVKYQLTIDPDTIVMQGDQTNLTLWRRSVIEKIKADPHHKKGFATQCRTQGSYSGYGVPIEVYFTVDIADYDEYCEYTSAFGSDITATLKDFGLKHYKVISSKPLQ